MFSKVESMNDYSRFQLNIFFVLFMIALSGLSVESHATERQVKLGDPILELTAADTEIVIASEAPPVVRFAAAELQKYLSEILGGPLAVTHIPQPQKKKIFLGLEQFSRLPVRPQQKLVRDAFFILNRQDGIYIGGRDDPRQDPQKTLEKTIWAQGYERATLFGVYDFLERFAGVRFYFPGRLGTIVPQAKSLKIPAAEIFECPDFTFRRIAQYRGRWPGRQASDQALKEKNLAIYRYRYETRHVPNCHGLARYGYLSRFAKSHPEYFALTDNGFRHNNPSLPHSGQLCFSSGIVEEIYQDAKSFLCGEPASRRGVTNVHAHGKPSWDPSAVQPGYFNVMPQDAYYRCRCEKCAPRFGSGVNYADEFMWQLVADWGNRLKREKVPGFLTMMAYRPYRAVPKVQLPDNVLVMVAEIGPWARYNIAGQARDLNEIRQWTEKLGHKVWLWNYLCKVGDTMFPGVPSPSPHAAGVYLKTVTPYISGAYWESETDSYLNNYLTYYVFGKYAWDNSVDTEAVLAEHHRLMFGQGAAEMTRIYDAFEKIWLTDLVGHQMDTAVGPLVTPPSDYKLWHCIYSQERLEEFRAAFDRAEKLTEHDRLSQERIRLFRHEWFDVLNDTRQKYISRCNALTELCCAPGTSVWLVPFRSKKSSVNMPPVETRVSMNIAERQIRIVFDCEEPDMQHQVVALREPDDPQIYHDCSVEVFLNPSGDRRNFYQLILNTRNCLSSLKARREGTRAVNDFSWNSGAEHHIIPTDRGFRAEITLSLDLFPEYSGRSFPVNFGRNRILMQGKDYDTLYTWSPQVRHFQDIENFGVFQMEELPPVPNVVDNGDFSVPCHNRWFSTWAGPLKLEPGQHHDLDRGCFFHGPQSLRLSATQGGIRLYVNQYLNKLKPDTEYILSYLVKLEKVNAIKRNGGVCVNINTGSNKWYPVTSLTGDSPQWLRQEFRFQTPPQITQRWYIRLYLLNATGQVWFDGVKITPVIP